MQCLIEIVFAFASLLSTAFNNYLKVEPFVCNISFLMNNNKKTIIFWDIYLWKIFLQNFAIAWYNPDRLRFDKHGVLSATNTDSGVFQSCWTSEYGLSFYSKPFQWYSFQLSISHLSIITAPLLRKLNAFELVPLNFNGQL